MTIKTTHPEYAAMSTKWMLGCDSYEGEAAIKMRGETYLPMTSGQKIDGVAGEDAYNAYKTRSVYPDLCADAVEAAIGVMHREPPLIELPAILEQMRLDATLLGESLESLLRRINARQLITGRLGLLADIRTDNDTPRPVIAIYNDLAIINWDDTAINADDIDLSLVVLDESGYERSDNFKWEIKTKHRVLSLTDENEIPSNAGTYSTALVDDDEVIIFTQPSLSGTTLEKIPFVFINSKDVSPTPDRPPLDGLARLALTIYRGEADYRQHLFMQAQDTLVRIGAHDDESVVRTGAGALIDVPQGGDAKYIGVGSSGLAEQRQALENDYTRAGQKSGQLLDTTSRQKESGDALKIRVAAQTATLPQIAKTGAAGLEKVLKILAEWYGANPDEVTVMPNLNFTDADLDGNTLVQIMQAKGLGAPISNESIHQWQQDKGLTKLTFEEERVKLATEEGQF